jgi:pilus assembly protein CpaF
MFLRLRRDDGTAELRELAPGIYSIGADPDNEIRLKGSRVSGRHAILSVRPEGSWIEDLRTPDGTVVGGRVVRGRGDLEEGQEVLVGPFVLQVFRERPEAREERPDPERAPKADGRGRGDRRQAIKQQIHRELLERLDIKRLTAAQVDEGELHKRVLATLEGIVKEVTPRLPPGVQPQALIKELYDEAVGLGPLEDLLADPEITEIMVNGPERVYVERHGKLEQTDRTFVDDKSVMAVIERIVSPLGRRIDESQPYVDARLKDGSRVNAIIHPLSLSGPCVTIRKFSKVPFTDGDLMRFGTLTEWTRDFLRACVVARKNIIVSGGTGSGKTTLLNVLSSFLPETDRILTIEDAAELRLKQVHVVALEARPPNIEGKGAIAIRDLVRNALRMRPDRIVVGECRGGEALDMLQAMNTGHDGSLTTLHANSPRDVISRLETMVLMSGMDLPVRAIREQIAAAIDLIVHLSRLSDGTRKIVSVSEVIGLEGERIAMQEIFRFEQTGIGPDGKVLGRFAATGTQPSFLDDLAAKGVPVDPRLFDPKRQQAS